MTAVDTSIVVRGFASWHPGHRAAVDVLADRPRLVGHVALESFSVLTRLPEPHRAPPDAVVAFLMANFPQPYLVLSATGHRHLVEHAAALGLTGGALYDAAVATAAKDGSEVLVSADQRAARVYDAVGAPYELLP